MPAQTKRRTAGSIVASVILSILLIGPLTLTVFLWELRGTVSEEGIRYYLDELDLSRLDLSGLGLGGSGNLLDMITNSINDSLGKEVVSSKELEKMIGKSTLKSFIAREIGDVIEDFKNGTSSASVTKKEITKFVSDNWPLLSALLPDMMNEEMEKAVQEQIAEGLSDDVTATLNTKSLRKELGSEVSGVLDAAFSMVPLYILLGICAFFVLLYFLADRRIVGDAFIGVGALLVTVMGPMALSGLRYVGQGEALLGFVRRNYLANYFSGAFAGINLTANLIGAGVGLGMIALGIVLNIATKPKTDVYAAQR